MDNFWTFLDVMAGILNEDDAVDRLNREMTAMSDIRRDKVMRDLTILATKSSRLVAMAGHQPVESSDRALQQRSG